MKFLRKNWLVIILLIIAGFLRFYKLAEWYFFNIDEDWFSFIVRKIIVYKKPVLIGWEIPGGLYTSPVMYYFGALLMFLFKNNPLGMAINASFWGIIGVYFIYKVGKKLFRSEAMAIYSTTIYTFSYLVNIYNRLTLTIWLSPILALLTYLSLKKLIEEGKKKWLIILSSVFVFATQEGSLISMIILSLVSFVVFRKKIRIKDWIIPVLVLLLSFLPLFIFDLRHSFLLSKKTVNFFSLNKGHPINLFSIISYFKLMFTALTRMLIPTGPNDLNIQILPCKNYLEIIRNHTPLIYSLFGLFITLLFVFYSLKKNLWGGKLISLHLLIVSFGLIFYSLINPGHLYEWFFVVLFPAFCFISAYFFDFVGRTKFGKTGVVFFLILFLFINLKYILTGTAAVGYQDKIGAVRYAAYVVRDKEFSLEMLGNGCNGYGYRYLFTYLNKEPAKSYMDYQYEGWLYPKKQEKDTSIKVILVPIVDLDTRELQRKYEELKVNSTQSEKFGNLEVLIIES
ncbi:MAG: glycosyltransferase family 39 protein [Candidatus Omnitrophica bacterium]|nr:glycosyltransferase family 39 protein [Candidatus Omnitrophota bacterium]